MHDLSGLLEYALRHIQLTCGVPRQTATHKLLGNFYVVAELFEHLNRGGGRRSIERGIEGIRPQHHRLSSRVGAPLLMPLAQGRWRETNEWTGGIQSADCRDEGLEPWRAHGEINNAWKQRNLVRDVSQQR